MKLKYCFTAYNTFKSIIKDRPWITGCYQWIRVFNGDVVDYKFLEDPEKYDVIQVNLDTTDCRIVSDLKRRLRDSSTIVVANQDYAPEIHHRAFEMYEDIHGAIYDADRVFATSPSAQGIYSSMAPDKQIWLNPHPCETHVIKKLGSWIKNEWAIIVYSRYNGDVTIPLIAMENSGIEFGLVGYLENSDIHAKRTKSSFKTIVNNMAYRDILKMIKEAEMGVFTPVSYSYGRVPCDFAALGTPLICSDKLYSAQKCFPLTSVDPYDTKRMTELALALKQESFREEVISLAEYNVEYFGHKACKERYMEMVEHGQ